MFKNKTVRKRGDFMAKYARILIFAILTGMIVFTAGCDIGKKAETLKNDLVNITLDQIALQLENSLNQEFPGIQVDTPQVMGRNGKVDWDQLRQTELGNFVFFSANASTLQPVRIFLMPNSK